MLEAKLSLSEQNLSESWKSLVLDFTLSNTSDDDLYFLKHNTPFEACHCFLVKKDGNVVEYDGPFFKRSSPIASDYIHIKGKENISTQYVISNFYDISKKGEYEIVLKKPFLVSLRFETEVFVDAKINYVVEEDVYRPTLGQLARSL